MMVKKVFTETKSIDSELSDISKCILGYDIGPNKSAKEYLASIYNYFDNIISSLPCYVYWKDKNFKYLGCNDLAAKLLKLSSRKEIVNKTDYDFGWKKEEADAFRKVDEEIVLKGEPKLNIEETISNEQDTLHLPGNKMPIFDDNHKVIGIIGVTVDITERKKLENQLIDAKERAEAANKAKTEFLENIRHDLRTPLTGIIGFNNLIKSEANNPKIIEYADNVQASSQALLELLNEVLEAMRIASGERPLLKMKFNLKTKLEQIIKLNLAKVHEKQLSLIFNYDDAIPQYLIGDPQRIQRIILNLMTNAINFTSQGKVEISTKLIKISDNGHEVIIKIIVSDTGIGIPEDRRGEIFERFKRLTPSYEGTYKGLGLGLAIVKQFIDDLDGEIYLESKLDEGSVFTCTLPLKKALSDDTFDVDKTSFVGCLQSELSLPMIIPQSPLNIEKNCSKDSTRILLVEDNALAARVAETLLKSLNCAVDTVSSGEAAIKFAKDKKYDLILMDIGLPDMNGNEAARKILVHESMMQSNRYTPIIALTAHVDSEHKQECLAAGMRAVFSKPLPKEAAIDMLNAFIPNRSKLNELSEASRKQIVGQENTLHQLPPDTIDLALGAYLISGDIYSAKKMIEMLLDTLPPELELLQKAYEQQDWSTIQKVVHKIYGGTCYCGTPRLKSACLNLRDYLEKNETELRDALYSQLLEEISVVEKAYEKVRE